MQLAVDQPPRSKRFTRILQAGRAVGWFLFWALVFGLAYTQAPLYFSNQNQYFLHGLASAHWPTLGELGDPLGDSLGDLHHDWLAQTADPTPVFSFVVALTHRFLHQGLFYVYFLLLRGLYFSSLVGIFDILVGKMGIARLGFITLLVGIHAGVGRWASAQVFGVDYPWFFQAGVAGQYILGAGLQPSVFGILLVTSLYAFLRDRPYLAATLAVLAAIFHSTYLLVSACFIFAYLWTLCRERRVREAALVGAWSLLLVLPLVGHLWQTFARSSSSEFAEAQWLLAHVRIPHHSLPERWFDVVAGLQVLWFGLALWLVRGGRLFGVLAIPALLGLLLTLVQLATGSDGLALLFPWRVSVVLIPLATTIILAWLFRWLAPWLERRSLTSQQVIKAACGITLAGFVVSGLAISYLGLGYRTDDGELPLLDYVRTHRTEGDTYLLPVELPKLSGGPRGVISTSFTPPPRRDRQGHLISVDLQRFRLATGAPIYVDFKSVPYKDAEVLEWFRRLLWTHQVYKAAKWDKAATGAELQQRQITHVIATAGHTMSSDLLEKVYEDDRYRVFRVR